MKYPALSRRYAATLIDLVLRGVILYACTRIPLISEAGAPAYWALGLAILLYEPLLTAYACTPGQALMRIRVRTPRTLKRMGFTQAVGRMLIKYSLAIVSVLTIPGRKDRRGIHDVAVGTIVVEAAAVAGAEEHHP